MCGSSRAHLVSLHRAMHARPACLQLDERVAYRPCEALVVQTLLQAQAPLVTDGIAAKVLDMQHPLSGWRDAAQAC